MAASTAQNPEVRSESKSALKKRAKAEAAAAASAASSPAVPETITDSPESANADCSDESPYLKELYKSVNQIYSSLQWASAMLGAFNFGETPC